MAVDEKVVDVELVLVLNDAAEVEVVEMVGLDTDCEQFGGLNPVKHWQPAPVHSMFAGQPAWQVGAGRGSRVRTVTGTGARRRPIHTPSSSSTSSWTVTLGSRARTAVSLTAAVAGPERWSRQGEQESGAGPSTG